MEEIKNSNIHNINLVCLTTNEFKNYILNNTYNENMFKSDGSLNPNYNNFKKTGLISDIFEDHWEEYYSQKKSIIDKYRPNADNEINKIIDCHNKNLGCSAYECPNCHDFIFVGHTCKSRLCTSCGYKYKLIRVENILEHAYNYSHRQIVFTISEELRCYFFFPFAKMMDILFDAVNQTIYSILNESYRSTKNKRKKKKYSSKTNYTPGFFMFLHTFGRDLKWIPHIHVLIAEIKTGGDMIYKKRNYFNYDALSKRFQKILLYLLDKELGNSFNKVKRDCFNKHKNGFYVYAEPKNLKTSKMEFSI